MQAMIATSRGARGDAMASRCLDRVILAPEVLDLVLGSSMLDRRKLLVGATAFAGYSALARAAAPYEWQTTSPAE
jgi:hypothetical protein